MRNLRNGYIIWRRNSVNNSQTWHHHNSTRYSMVKQKITNIHFKIEEPWVFFESLLVEIRQRPVVLTVWKKRWRRIESYITDVIDALFLVSLIKVFGNRCSVSSYHSEFLIFKSTSEPPSKDPQNYIRLTFLTCIVLDLYALFYKFLPIFWWKIGGKFTFFPIFFMKCAIFINFKRAIF